ncbi:MAG: hypothetical protein ABEJ76_01805 [Halanaeroarchaeum sp.]
MEPNPLRHRLHGSPDPAAISRSRTVVGGVTLLAVSGLLVLVASYPVVTLVTAIGAATTAVGLQRSKPVRRPSLPTGTRGMCLPCAGVCIEVEARLRREGDGTD